MRDEERVDLEAALRAPPRPTRRPTVGALEERLFAVRPVLDHGFVRVVDYMGDDAAIVQAARVSYGAGTRSVRSDRGLLRYLARHRHTTPFEMCEIKLHVKLPIFVARQWIRHRTASVNEYSARYSILDADTYLPAPEAVAAQASSNRQGRGEVLGSEQATRVLEVLRTHAGAAWETYEDLLNDDGTGTPREPGRPQLARELARIGLTLGHYTQWYWKIDLHNLLHFLSLRLDRHAQYEFRCYAEAIADIVCCWVPLAWEAFEDYQLHAATFSREEMEILRAVLRGGDLDALLAGSDLTAREKTELRARLGREDTRP
jgi:thymidylate synthase (FAD)